MIVATLRFYVHTDPISLSTNYAQLSNHMSGEKVDSFYYYAKLYQYIVIDIYLIYIYIFEIFLLHFDFTRHWI